MKTATPVLDIVESRLDQVTEEVHEYNVRHNSWRGAKNTLNNHTFMNLVEETGLFNAQGNPIRRYTLVEVVRKGRNNTRIRRVLDSNGSTELVNTTTLVEVLS
jgi:hypothetical protein